jgi:adenylate cyclase
MDEHDAQRFIDEQRYQAELPFPVSAVFTHYAHSSSKNYALRSLQLVATAQSTIRYAAIVAACDYATNPEVDETVLNQLRLEWLGGKKPSFGTWYGALMKLLSESGKSWKNQFVLEFAKVDSELLEKRIQPLIHGRNVEIGHAEYYEALAMKHFVELQEENLFAVMDQFSFLARYPLAFVEVEDEYETPSPGTKQAVNICRGASHNFARYTVAPSHPLPPGIPFIWNDEYTGILTLSPFIIYGRATTDAEQKEKVKGVAHIQGLMVLNGVTKGAPVYTSVDAEAQFSLDSFEFPPKEQIQKQVESALKKGLNVPSRIETRLSEDEKELFVRTTDFVAPSSEEDRGRPSKRKPYLKTMLVSAIIGVLVLLAGFALYSHYKTSKATLPVVQGVKSIAVLPFRDLSPNKDMDYLCDGIAEEISNRLQPIEGIKVIGSKSTIAFKDKPLDLREIKDNLHINTVLDGSLRKDGDRLRISVQLISVEDGTVIWPQTFDRKAGDILEIEDEIAKTIAQKLKGALKEEEQLLLIRNYTKNLEAYNLYLQGLKYNRENNPEQAQKCFEEAIKKDDKFVPAIVWFAAIIFYNKEFEKKSRWFLNEALKIDSTYADAHALNAKFLSEYDWKFNEALKECKRALSLNPGSMFVRVFYYVLSESMRRFDDCLSEMKKELEIDPLNPWTYITQIATYVYLEQYDDAEKAYLKAKELFPDNQVGVSWVSRAYCLQGRYKKAIETYLPSIESSDDAFLGYFYAKLGEKDKAKQIINNLMEKATKEYVSPVWIALIYNGLGENDNVFTWLEKALKNHDPLTVWINPWPEFQNLRSDPRYHELLKKIGLEK